MIFGAITCVCAFGKKAAIFRLIFLCHQAANFNIFEVAKIFIDFSNVKVSNEVIHLSLIHI